MHHIYHTEGFVLKGINSFEANKTYFIFTKDFGLIKATAQGIRLLKSKLRYSIDTLSKVEISIVKGKDFWRIVGVNKIWNYKDIGPATDDPFSFVSRIFSLLIRFVHGEEKNEEMFYDLDRAFDFFDTTHLKEELEILTVAKILFHLGHIGDIQCLLGLDITEESLEILHKKRGNFVLKINDAIKESHF